MKVIVHSPKNDIDFFDIAARVLQADALAPFLFIIWLDYALQTSINLMKEKFHTKEKQEADDIHQKLLDANYTDDLALLTNTSAEAESRLHSLE